LASSYENDDAKRLFSFAKGNAKDMKCYVFQYYLWPKSCSIRYNCNALSIFILAILYQIILQMGINTNSFANLESNPLVQWTLNLALVWVCTITLGNILEYSFSRIANRPMVFDYSLCLDILLLVGILLQFSNVPERYIDWFEPHATPDEQLSMKENFYIFLNAGMALFVWAKIGSFVMTTKQFGVYIRMITHMIQILVIFIVIWGAWVVCSANIFCMMFH